MLYRIQTENQNLEFIIKRVAVDFNSFTIIKAEGYWLGVKELSVIIEIEATEHVDGYLVENIALWIKRFNDQERFYRRRN